MKPDAPLFVDIMGNEGETEGQLAIVTVPNVSPLFPNNGRIMIGSAQHSAVHIPIFNVSPDRALQLAAFLIAAANQCVANCPSATDDATLYPAYIASRADDQ